MSEIFSRPAYGRGLTAYPGEVEAMQLTAARIVLICDSAGHGEDLAADLRVTGYVVDVYLQADGIAALGAGDEKPVAVILDFQSIVEPAVIAEINQRLQSRLQYSVPVIFISARKDVSSRLAAYRAGITRFLPRPVSRYRMQQMLAEVVAPRPVEPYRIMLVMDDAVQLEQHADVLRRASMLVKEVSDPMLALEQLADFAAEAVVVAMDMQCCSGAELAVLIRDDERFAATSVIYLLRSEDPLLAVKAVKSSDYYLNSDSDEARIQSLVVGHARRARSARKQGEALRIAMYELERQQQAFDAHAIVSVANASGEIIMVNEKFCEISGYTRQELLGQNHRIVKSGLHPQEFYAGMWQTISAGEVWHGEVCNRKKNGEYYWVSTSIVPFLDQHGLPYQYISIRTDISRVKESEQRLERSQEFSGIGTWDWNVRDGSLSWSERLVRLFGYKPGQLTPTYEHFLSALHPDDAAQVKKAISDCVERGIGFSIEHRCIWPNGTVHWLSQRGDVVRDTRGNPTHMLGLVQDISARKEAEMGLVQSHAQLEEAQSLAHIGSWELDRAQNRMQWSDELYSIFGQSKLRFTPGVNVFAGAAHPEDIDLLLETEQAMLKSGSLDLVYRIVRPDGEVRYVHELARMAPNGGNGFGNMRGTIQDVTVLRVAELAVIKAKEEAEMASRAKSEFLASMSHELRTPLNAILGFSQIFALNQELPQETRNNAKQIERAGQHLLSLVNDLIDLARIESSRLELNIDMINLKDVAQDCINLVKSMAHDKSIQLLPMQCDAMHVLVRADFVRLRQSLLNLLSNAIKYNKPQGSVQLRCEVAGSKVRVTVTDTGYGIAPGMQARVFNQFDRLGAERGSVEGTGIGLLITKRLVEAMGGAIGFASKEGEGSSFWLEFDLASQGVADGNNVAVNEQYGEGMSEGRGGKRVVLYVEDNQMNMRLMQQIFSTRAEWGLLGAADAESGVQMARENSPDLILMDINLPGMDGYQALAKLRSDAHTANIPVVAITANAMKGDREKGIEAGFAEYLTKPLDIVQLMTVLGKFLK